MIDVYEQYNATVLGVQQVPDSEVSKYGIIKGTLIENRIYRVEDMVENLTLITRPPMWPYLEGT